MVTRILLSALRLAGFLALLPLLGAGALALRLAEGPISLEPVAERLTALVERAGPFTVTFARPALAWSREQSGVLLEVQELEVRTPAGQLVAAAPAVGLRFDAAALVRDRQLRLRETEIRLPELQLVRRADESLVLEFGGHLGALPLDQITGGGGGVGSGGGVLGNLAGGAAEAGDPRLERLRRIRVDARGLRFTDEGAGRTAETGPARLRLTREEGGWELRLDVDAIAGAEGSELRVTAAPPPEGAGAARVVVAELERLPLALLDGLLPNLPSLAGVDLPVSGEVRMTLEPGASSSRGPATFRLTSPGGRAVLPPDVMAGTVGVRSAAVAGEVGSGWRDVRVTESEVRLEPAGVVRATGTVARGDEATRLGFDITTEDLDPAGLKQLWPLGLARNTRRWVVENVEAGRLPRARVDAVLPRGAAAGRPDEVALSFDVADGAFRFLDAWPPARGANGTGRLEGDRFTLNAGAFRVGEVRVAKADLVFTRLRSPEPALLDIALEAEGTVPAALDLLGREPLRLTRALGFEPGVTRGRAKASVGLTIPLKPKVDDTEIGKRGTVTLGELGVREVRPGYDVTGGELRLELGDAQVLARGEIGLNGVPARLTWLEHLSGKPAERRRMEVAGRLTPERAVALRAGWPDWASGALDVAAVVTEGERRPRRIDLDADLAPLGLAVPDLALAKAAGVPGRLVARLEQPEDKRILAREATITWADDRLRGGGEFRLDPFEWRQLDLREVHTGAADLKGTLAREGEVVRARIEAERLDLRPVREARAAAAAAAAPGGEGDAETPFDLDLAATRLFLGPEPLEAVGLTAAHRGGRLTAADFKTRLPGGDKASLQLQAATLPGEFRGEAGDLGALLRGLGVERSRLEGGRGRVEGRVEARDGGTVAWAGEAKLREFVVKDAPALARILSLASLQGLGDTLAGRGLQVDRVTLPFTWAGERVELRQARMVGSALGGRVDGTVDLDTRRLALDGTVAPLYGLTRFIGQIPILGNLLRGEKADAALAATFTVSGSIDEPQVAVNPLSALVPGAIRDLFGDLLENAERPETPEARD